MKVNRINVVIKRADNLHRPYLYNEMLDLMQIHKFGGEFKTDSIKLSSMPEVLTRILDKLKIIYSK